MTYQNLLTVTEFGQFCPEVDTTRYNEATISGYISAASKVVSDYLEYSPLQETITDEVKTGLITSEGDLLIFPTKLPLVTVSSIAIFKGTTSVALNLQVNGTDKFNVSSSKTNIRYPWSEMALTGVPIFTDFYSLRHTQFFTKITYVGGWLSSDLPQTIKVSTSLIIKDMLSGQYNPTGATRFSQGAVSFGFSAGNKGMSPNMETALRLLNPYRGGA